MSAWLANYWYMVWAFLATGALVAFRMRRRGGDESILRRVMFALIPYSDPARSPQRQVSVRAAVFLSGAVLVVTFAYLLFLQSR